MTQPRLNASADGTPTRRSVIDRRIFLLSGAMFATGTDALVAIGLLPMIATDLGIDPGTAGVILTAHMVAFAVSSPFLTALFAKRRPDRIIPVSIFLFALAALGSAVAPNISVLIVLRVFAACCWATYGPLAFVAAVALSPAERRGTGIAVASLGLVVAQLAGIPLGRWVGTTFGWRMAYVFDAGLVLSFAVALAVWRAPARSSPVSPSLAQRFRPLGKPDVVLALLPVIFWGVAFAIIYTTCAVFFGAKIGSEYVSALLLSAGVGGLLGSQVGGWISDRFGPAVPLLGFVSLNAANVGLISLTGATPFGAAIGMFVLSFCSWGLSAPQRARLLTIDPPNAPLILALNNSISHLGLGLGAALGGILISRQWLAALPYTGAISYLAALCFVAITLSFQSWSSRAAASSAD
jgi:MFS transporter, DHA1 family, inner membrane transport protein